MNETNTGIEKEAISFLAPTPTTQPKTLEVKYEITGSTFKTQLPIFKSGTAEEFLHFLHDFNQARQRLGYSSYQKLESGIEQLLQGTARNEWNTIKATLDPNSNNLDTFTRRLDAFRRIYIPEPAAIETQKNYLQRVKKNDKLTVPQFLDRLKHINMLLLQFPNATQQDQFTAEEIKNRFYYAMPLRWRKNYINSGSNLSSSTIESLRTYMVQQEIQTDAHRKQNRESNKKTTSQRSSTGNFNSNSRQNRNKRSSGRSNQRQGQGQKDSKRKRLSNDDDCPIHGSSHKWGQCHQNQYGENFKPRRQSSTNNNGAFLLQGSQGTSTTASPRRHPSQVQVYHNDLDSLSQDNRSQGSSHQNST